MPIPSCSPCRLRNDAAQPGNVRLMQATALRPMMPDDVPVLAAIAQASIDELTIEDYDDAQRDAWVATAADEASLRPKLTAALTLVATIGGAPVGFIALRGAQEIDMLYVYPDVARQGVGSLLLGAIEKLATARGGTKLSVAASDNAKPFFETHGFVGTRRQTVAIGDCWLGNTHMEKTLAAKAPG